MGLLFLFRRKKNNVAQGSMWPPELKMIAAVGLWCRERAVTSASLVVGWRWRGVAGTESLLASHRSVLKLGPCK